MSQQPADEMTRASNLANAVTTAVAGGWRVESQTSVQAVLAKGKPVSHGIHIFLSIITVGIWLFVWGGIVLVNRRQTMVITVDQFGNVLQQKN